VQLKSINKPRQITHQENPMSANKKATEQKKINDELNGIFIKRDPILDAFDTKKLQRVEQLLAAGAQLSSLDISDRMRLFDAANKLERMDLALQVAKSGIDWNPMAKNEAGKSWMNPVFMSKNTLLDELMLSSDFDLTSVDGQNRSMLHLACMVGQGQTVSVLLERGVRLDTMDDGGRLPLHVAAEFGHADICRRLVEHGEDVNALSRLQKSPLFIAVCKGHEDASMEILRLGGDPLFLFKGKSLSEWAEKEGHPRLSEKLKAVQASAKAGAELSKPKQAKELPVP
jgi:hypothetical protein